MIHTIEAENETDAMNAFNQLAFQWKGKFIDIKEPELGEI
jgi:hypothetical protein